MTDNNKERDTTLDVLKAKPISAWPFPRILVGVLQERAMSYASFVFYDFWCIAQQGVPIIRMPYIRTDIGRNKLAVELLKTDYTHLLMLDIDHRHPVEIVQRLARWVLLKPDEVKVVGGLNFRRGEPFDPCCGWWGKEGDAAIHRPTEWTDGLMKVDMVGTGSLLISRDVFELIPPPWFFNDYSRVWADEWPGEDVSFSRLCNEYGVDLFVDTTCTSPHMTSAMITEDTFRNHLEKNESETTTYDEFVERVKEQA